VVHGASARGLRVVIAAGDIQVDARPSPAPVISVIIPTCDRPRLVNEAIRSALSQSLSPAEILVIDNGKIPLRPDMLPSRCMLHRMAPRVGPSVARNLGAAKARGEYLAFLDDDDCWAPTFLAEAWAALAKARVRCVYGRKCVLDGGNLRPYRLAAPEDITIPVLLRRNPGIGGINLLLERSLFVEVGGFDERLRLSEDRALAIEMLLAGVRIGTAPDAIAIVRHHAGNRLRQRRIRKLQFVWQYRRFYGLAGFLAAIARVIAISCVAPLAAWGREQPMVAAPPPPSRVG
jgi:GT2 family glycosyltransferase